MKKGAIIALLLGCCALCFSQELAFSRRFEAVKKNVPLAIINSQPNYFYVLRYNKAVHDLTIERRAKPSAEIIAFTPLKLDSVNASWFDYEQLDYLFYEHHKKLYFVFERVVNQRKSLYLKVVDTLAKSSGFIPLAELEKEKSIRDFEFEFKKTDDDNILIVASQTFFNGLCKKTVMLYDIDKRQMAWVKKLPLENSSTGFSRNYACNANGDLFYVEVKSRIVGYQRRYMNHAQVNVPVFFHDTINLVSYSAGSEPLLHKAPLLVNVAMLNSIVLLPGAADIAVLAHVGLQQNDSAEAKIYFFAKRQSADLQRTAYTVTTPLRDSLEKMLTFYDGGDLKTAASKEYNFIKKFETGSDRYVVSGRREDNYYKELLVWQTNLQNGQTAQQLLIPRKVYSFKGRTRFKNMGEAMLVFSNNRLHALVLEAGGNFKKAARDFNYHRFGKETNLWRANIVMYTVEPGGRIEKKLVYHNTDFDMAPLNYASTNQNDVVLYLSSGKYEKFAILQLYPSS